MFTPLLKKCFVNQEKQASTKEIKYTLNIQRTQSTSLIWNVFLKIKLRTKSTLSATPFLPFSSLFFSQCPRFSLFRARCQLEIMQNKESPEQNTTCGLGELLYQAAIVPQWHITPSLWSRERQERCLDDVSMSKSVMNADFSPSKQTGIIPIRAWQTVNKY